MWTRLLLTPWPKALSMAVGLAALLCLPALGFGFFADDYLHLGVIEKAFPTMGGRFDLFTFSSGNPQQVQENWLARGPFPWWTLPDLKLAFFRPLSSALAVMDHSLFGRFSVPYHLHVLVWFLGMVALWGVLLRRILPGPTGALAVILFAIDDSHWLPAAWWANRNALVSAVFGLLALLAHHRFRTEGKTLWLAVSVGCLTLALLGGESALGIVGYLIAYEVFAPGSRWKRGLALVPHGVISVGYLIIYKYLGYGTFHSGSYIDPLAEPQDFLLASLVRLPVLLGGLIGGLPADLWLVWPGMRPLLWAFGFLFLGMYIWLLRRAAPQMNEEEKRALKWLSLGALLSLIPVAATFPTSRLLLLPSLGGAAVTAAILTRWYGGWAEVEPSSRRERFRRFACLGLMRIHTIYAPLLLTGTIIGVAAASHAGLYLFRHAEIDDSRVAGQRMVMLTSADPAAGLYPPTVRRLVGSPLPEAWWPISFAPHDHRLDRIDSQTFTLTVLSGEMMETEFEVLFRDPQHPLKQRDEFVLDGLSVRVEAMGAKGPVTVRCHFDRSLDDPSLGFLAWKDGKLKRVILPAVGGSMILAASRPNIFE